MLKDLNVDQARFVALLAKAARAQRDALLGGVAEDDLAKELSPARGEHNPVAILGFDPLPASAPQMMALREAIASLSPMARSELYTLVRIGQGDVAANKWHRGLSEASLLGDETIAAAMTEDADLDNHILKALYEADLAS
jgi:hypothetical protein